MPAYLVPAQLLAELHSAPALDDAACRGLPGMWDSHLPGETPDDTTTRQHLAARVCRTCRARPACALLAASLPVEVLDGVWAGQIHRHRTVWGAGAA